VTDSDLIFYQFSRDKVERGDFTHFLSLYSPDKLPSGRRLRLMMNAICEQGQMFERLIYDRSKAVFEYFGLPYDARRQLDLER
jgi:hypothetical protein